MTALNTSLLLNQALVSQENRLIKLTTSLGADTLLPHRVVAYERLGRGYEYTIDCISTRDDIGLKKFIAQPVTLWVQQIDRAYLPMHGYVQKIKRLGSDGQFTFYQMAFAPWLNFLKFRKDARIWQDKAADDILSDVFGAHAEAMGNFRFDVRAPARQRSYCTQYETEVYCQ